MPRKKVLVPNRKVKKLAEDFLPFFYRSVGEGAHFRVIKFSKMYLMGCWLSRPYDSLVWGNKLSGSSLRSFSLSNEVACYSMEDAFLRSFDCPAKSKDPLGVVLDKKGIYYDSRKESDLEVWLNVVEVDESYRDLASQCMQMIREFKLSKYNGIDASAFSLDKSRYALVVDQVKGDMSVEGAMASVDSFDKMMCSALSGSDYDILLKVHPDVTRGEGKEGYIKYQKYIANPRVHLIDYDVNLWDVFSFCELVYTVSSQVGFEALIAGKKVYCFGVPFYSGWGLTVDDVSCDRRVRERSLEEVFYLSYIKYSRYINPFLKKEVSLLEACQLVSDKKRHADANLFNSVCVGFSPWKKKFISDFVSVKGVTQVLYQKKIDYSELCLVKTSVEPSKSKYSRRKPCKKTDFFKGNESVIDLPLRVVVWASSDLARKIKKEKVVLDRVAGESVPVFFMEDGFLRSVGLGADLARPCSLVLDSRGIYYDPSGPSDLESLLENHSFFDSDLRRSKLIRQSILSLRLSKYNISKPNCMANSLSKIKGAILVPGQVEDDASIKAGCIDVNTNLGLLRAVRESNPESFIIYKQHPDVLKAGRKGMLKKEDILAYADLEAESGSILDWIDGVCEVHTMTSLAGFEALLREKKVVTYGLPFYAGWGLTEDRHRCERRTQRRTLDELVAAALIYYPTYVDPVTQKVCNVETILERLSDNLNKPHKPSIKTQIIRKIQRWKNSLKVE